MRLLTYILKLVAGKWLRSLTELNMKPFLVIWALSQTQCLNAKCANPNVINNTALVWNKIDNRNLKSAVSRCPVKYPNSPCLVKFIKIGYNEYQAICGKAR
jgi:hypothetical protein